ncbi:MAG: segregation/condensation protein A [bacterium]|nr:segregation/condensation protein A [bacterium]
MEYTFCINDFEGPLDLLLHLVRQSKMDIYEINLFDLIKQYLDFIHKMEDLNIDVASEYLSMASELVHLKSRMLINRKEEEESEVDDDFELKSEEDLRKKILEYENIKNITGMFKNLEAKRNNIYTKLPENLKVYYEETTLKEGLYDVDTLYNAFLAVQKKYKLLKPLDTTITKKEISVEKRSEEIRNILKIRGKVDFFSLFSYETKEYLVVTFLSILTMSKNKELKITQEDNFSPIILEGLGNE